MNSKDPKNFLGKVEPIVFLVCVVAILGFWGGSLRNIAYLYGRERTAKATDVTDRTDNQHLGNNDQLSKGAILSTIGQQIKSEGISQKKIISLSHAGKDAAQRSIFHLDLRDLSYDKAINLLRSLDEPKQLRVKAFAIRRTIAGLETFRGAYRIAYIE